MRKITICLLVLLSSLAAFGQRVPQWTVVHSVILKNQMSPISSTVVNDLSLDHEHRSKFSLPELFLRSPDRGELVFAFSGADQSPFFQCSDRAPVHTCRPHDLVIFDPA
jgi:hypothetical protein